MYCAVVVGVVAVLTAQLGNDSFSVRAEAQRQLTCMVQADNGLPVLRLVEALADTSDPEVVQRVRWIRSAYCDLGVYSWIDMLEADYPKRQDVLDKYLRQARTVVYCGGPEWPEYRLATRLYVRDMLVAGVPRRTVQRLLVDMAVREDAWKAARARR